MGHRNHPVIRRVPRRRLLQWGALGAAGCGLSLPELWAAKSVGYGTPPIADNCVLLFLDGGPSHLDMWDMKPDTPEGIRGEFKPISTSLPGYQAVGFLRQHFD